MPKAQKTSAREAAFTVALQTEREAAYANLALKKYLDQHALSPADARLAAQIVYGTARMKIALDHIISQLLTRPSAKLMTEARVILRLSLFQLVYLSRIEPYAVTDEAVELARRHGNEAIARLVNAVLRNYLRREDRDALLPGREAGFDYLHLTLSYPKWLADYLLRRFGFDEAERFCLAMNDHPGVYLRTNTVRLRREELQAALRQCGVTAAPAGYAYETLRVDQGAGRIASGTPFLSGGCTVQGPASQLAAHALHPESGSRVLDLCAAPGGKTTHLAALMADRGDIRAFDVHPHKIALIEANLKRLGLTCVKAEAADSRNLPESFHEWADYILLDAPCSGLGVLNARPDSRFHKRPEDIKELAETAYELLRAAAGYLKPGGSLCYATCTVTHEENEDNIRRFLAERPDFSLQPVTELAAMMSRPEDAAAADSGMIQLLPHVHGTEGFFLALLKKG